MHLKSFNPQKNAGFTLIELLIGLTLGLMVIAST
ncbi:MAG: prepilin-type N-terminal cleavage/methylation domain-containing protein, partial [Methylococcales bacterium]|nr:prepilin-type N-terminal cleavage/methylation domain-containing protein [Methylococcales bacterium]